MYMYLHMYMHMYIHMYMHMYLHMYMYVYVYVCMCIYIHVCVQYICCFARGSSDNIPVEQIARGDWLRKLNYCYKMPRRQRQRCAEQGLPTGGR